MSSLAIKLFACIAMFLDHYGYTFGILSPYRLIGRLAFPLFAFQLTLGYIHTKSVKKYLTRLFIFAIISEVPYNLFTTNSIIAPGSSLNIFFTLTLALLTLYFLDYAHKRCKDKTLKILVTISIIAIACIVAQGLHLEYGYYGILTVICFRYLNKIQLIIAYPLLILSFAILGGLTKWNLVQFFALFSLVPIFLYNGKKGLLPKKPLLTKLIQYGFYIFYPLHLLIFFLIR